MGIQYQFFEVVLVTFLLSCFAADARAQQSSQQQDLRTLSPPIDAALYPEVMCVNCIVPQWNRGYILHREVDKDPAMVTMYDRNGKKVLEGRMGPDAAKVSVFPQVADLYEMAVKDSKEGPRLIWRQKPEQQQWLEAREGAYLLRTNLTVDGAADLWKKYMQL